MNKEELLQALKASIGRKLGREQPHLSAWLDGTLREVSEDGFAVEFMVRPDMANPMGLFHGGAQAAIIDDVIGLTAYASDLAHRYVSINLSIDFLGAAKIGDTVLAKSRLVRQGKQILHVECDLYDERGRLISKGASNMFRRSTPKKEER